MRRFVVGLAVIAAVAGSAGTAGAQAGPATWNASITGCGPGLVSGGVFSVTAISAGCSAGFMEPLTVMGDPRSLWLGGFSFSYRTEGVTPIAPTDFFLFAGGNCNADASPDAPGWTGITAQCSRSFIEDVNEAIASTSVPVGTSLYIQGPMFTDTVPEPASVTLLATGLLGLVPVAVCRLRAGRKLYV